MEVILEPISENTGEEIAPTDADDPPPPHIKQTNYKPRGAAAGAFFFL